MIRPNPKSQHGDLMTLEEFGHCVEHGLFIDYDGFGYLATEDKMSDVVVLPSEFASGKLNLDYTNFTHVVWFNK